MTVYHPPPAFTPRVNRVGLTEQDARRMMRWKERCELKEKASLVPTHDEIRHLMYLRRTGKC